MAKDKPEPKHGHKPIYVIVGEESPLVDTECDRLIGRLLKPQEKLSGFFSADPAGVSISQILDELRTLPFLTEKRVVLIKGADTFVSQNRKLLENYFANPCPTGILILTVTTWLAQTHLAKKLPGVGELITITEPKPWQLPQRVISYANEVYGKQLPRPAAELLVELTGDDLGRLYGEVDKLAVFADSEKVITANHVELLIGHNRFFNVFAAIDAVTDGNVAQAVSRLRNMFAEDKSAEYTFVGAFAFNLRRMFNAKSLLEKDLSDSEVAGKLNIRGDRNRFFAQLRKLTLKQIGSLLQQLAEVDYAIKTGQTKAKVAAEQLVFKMVAG